MTPSVGMPGVAHEATPAPQRPASPGLAVTSGRTVAGLLAEGAWRHPDRLLLVFEDAGGSVSTWTWAEGEAQARRAAALLAGYGIGPGDRVHLHLPNRPDFLFLWFAAAHLGAAIVPTNTAASPHELAFILGHARARLSLSDTAGVATVAAARELGGVGGLALDVDAESFAGDGLAPLSPGSSPARPEDELAIMYTSGTTANPKGVRITQANYLYAGEVVAGHLRLGPEDRFLTVLPLFHANAQNYSTMGTLVGGGTLLLMHRFSASRLLDQAVRHGATVASLFAAPMRMMLAQDPTPAWRTHTLRTVIFAQNLTPAEVEHWEEAIGAPLLQIYGMTETVGPAVMNPLHGVRHPDAIGRPALGYSCRVVTEDGSPAAPGEPGELLVGGVPGISLMAGYLDDEAATARALVDGWLHTGDLVSVDADGFLRFVDRQKDMIKRSGENVAASEVEAVLLAHPAVGDAAVIGVPDPVRDEQIIACVVLAAPLEDPEAELIDWCAQRLASFRVPSRVQVLSELPRTAVGKIQKHRLRAGYLAGRS